MLYKIYKTFTSSSAFALVLLGILFLAFNKTNAQQVRSLDNPWPVKSDQYYLGFENVVSGSELDFFPFLEKGYISLYLGENGKYKSIEFQTQSIPEDYSQPFITYIWGCGMAKSIESPPSEFRFFIDNKAYMTINSYSTDGLMDWQYENEEGIHLAFVHTTIAKANGDLFGYMILNLPVEKFTKGKPVTIKMDEIRSNNRDYYMAIQNPVKQSFSALAEPAILKTKDGPKQTVKVDITHLGKPADGNFYLGEELISKQMVTPGSQEYYLEFDPVEREIETDVKVLVADREPMVQKIKLKPVRNFEVYFLPHSHVDIGFTHKQDEVARLQWENLDLAIDLAEKTKDYPDGSRYKWNAEISWVLDGYLQQASEERKNKFVDAVNQGSIGIDALYGSVLTGLQREEELFNNTLFANQLADRYDFNIQSAMITDVPGYTWGIVPALAQTGIKYFSIGPNHMPQLAHGGWQVGKTFESWGDVPMYWKSPSGKEKILFWMSSHGYSWFHSWLMGNISHAGGTPILKFLDELDLQKYPYDIVQLRYNIGNDNGPPDPDMPEFFRQWNDKYEWPKFKIATTIEMMTAFENRYADIIPEASGDFTPYWEDGATSSAKETALNRNTADRLVQAETMWALTNPENFPKEEFDKAWKNVVLFSEHTWGANISKSDPDSEFTKSLWDVKQGFTLDAQSVAEEMITKASSTLVDPAGAIIESVQVVNTLSWSRSQLIRIPENWMLSGDKILDANGNGVASQRLSTGELVFVAKDVPPFGTRQFNFKKGKAKSRGSVKVNPNAIENEFIKVVLDVNSGAITSITNKTKDIEYIDTSDSIGFNAYWYSGIAKENLSRNHLAKISVKESGPLLSSLQVETSGAGANKIIQIIEIVSGFEEVNLINIVDKIKIVDNENVRFSFPFSIPNGEIRIDIPWSVLEPGKNQLKGANNNFYSAQRFLDVSNNSYGITLTTEDAPIWEIGDMYGQMWMTDMVNRPWLKEYEPSQRLFAWVMNNIWFVNYKAHQEGEIKFRHTLKPHGQFNAADSKKLGMEKSMPMIMVPGDVATDQLGSYVQIVGSDEVIATSLKPSKDGLALLLRLFNSSPDENSITLNWKDEPSAIYQSSPLEQQGEKIDNKIILVPWEILTLKIMK